MKRRQPLGESKPNLDRMPFAIMSGLLRAVGENILIAQCHADALCDRRKFVRVIHGVAVSPGDLREFGEERGSKELFLGRGEAVENADGIDRYILFFR